tara:strand:+ start:17529 stop:19028 length:1500 start_codon:yes stop_codon:yes gene_type:complete
MKKILINTFSNYVFKGSLIILNIIAIPIFINEVGSGNYGVLILASTFLANFFVFDLGILAGVTKFVATFKAKGDQVNINKVISTTLFISICFGVLICLTIFSLINLGLFEYLKGKSEFMEDAKTIFLIAGLLSIIAWPIKVFDAALQGLQKFVLLNIFKGIGKVTSILLAIYFATNDFPLAYIFLALNFELFFLILFLGYVLKRSLPGLLLSFDYVSKQTFLIIFSFSSWIMLSQIAVLIEYQVDTLIIGLFLPIAAIAAYVVTIYPFRIIHQISGLAASAIMPAVAEMHAKEGDDGIEPFVIYGSRWHNALLASTALATFICCYPFINIWMNGQFNQYIWVAQLSCLFQLSWQANAMVGQVYIGAGYSKKLGLIAIVTSIFNLIFSLILVKIIGLEGVIIATVLAGLIGQVIFVLICFADIRVSRKKYIYHSVLKGQFPAIACFVIFLPFFKQIQSIESWSSLIIIFSLIITTMLLTSFFFTASKNDKRTIMRYLKNT